jgi:hypothetical protein
VWSVSVVVVVVVVVVVGSKLPKMLQILQQLLLQYKPPQPQYVASYWCLQRLMPA